MRNFGWKRHVGERLDCPETSLPPKAKHLELEGVVYCTVIYLQILSHVCDLDQIFDKLCWLKKIVRFVCGIILKNEDIS